MEQTLGFITIDYDDVNPASYNGVLFSMDISAGRIRFHTGNPETDWKDVLGFVQYLVDNGQMVFANCSSSVDHFVMDGGTLE